MRLRGLPVLRGLPGMRIIAPTPSTTTFTTPVIMVTTTTITKPTDSKPHEKRIFPFLPPFVPIQRHLVPRMPQVQFSIKITTQLPKILAKISTNPYHLRLLLLFHHIVVRNLRVSNEISKPKSAILQILLTILPILTVTKIMVLMRIPWKIVVPTTIVMKI